MSNLGATFRKARETSGLPLEKIAAETKISARFLLAIESESFNLLPGGIFNRGFIRSYAEYLGLDSEQAVADYDRMFTKAQEPLEVLVDAERESSRKSDRNLYPIAAAILFVSVIAYYLVTRKPSTSTEQAPQSTAEKQATLTPISAPAAVDALPKLETAATVAPPSTAPTTPTPSSSTAQPTPPTQEISRPPATTAPAASTLALEINANSQTWVKVTSDGTVALADILQPGTERRFSAERSLNVTIGNAAGVTLKINGRELKELGPEGKVRELRITPENAAEIR
jgi:cytoskeleton protein RodZ